MHSMTMSPNRSYGARQRILLRSWWWQQPAAGSVRPPLRASRAPSASLRDRASLTLTRFAPGE